MDFSVLAPTNVDMTIGGDGNYVMSLSAAGSTTPLYSLDGRQGYGTSFQGTIPLTLQPGTYELSAMGSHYLPMAGVIYPGGIGVIIAPAPIPATGWLFASGALALGMLFERRRRKYGEVAWNGAARSADICP